MRRFAVPGLALVLGFALTVVACGDEGTSVVEIDAEGAVAGQVWLDRNGNGLQDADDAPIADVLVEFLPGPGGDPAFSGRSGPEGDFSVTGVEVGDYTVRVDSATAGDSVRVLRVDSARVTVTRDTTAVVTVGFTYPTMTVDTARRQPLDTRLFVEGRALNAWETYGDSTVHVRDTTGAVRVVRLPPTTVGAGDSVRLQGAVSVRAGQPVLRDGPIFVIETGVESPAPDTVAAADAAAADGGRLDADLVHLDSVVIQDTTINALGETTYIVEDASGAVNVLIDRSVRFRPSFDVDVIGTILDVTGLLVPSPETDEWIVKPRSSQDVVVGPLSYPILPVIEARAEPADTRVQVEGLALSRWSVFGDRNLFVRDTTGAIRSVRVEAVSVAPGDSVRLLGTTAELNTQPVLRDVKTTVVEEALQSPAPDTVSAAQAAAAGNAGTLDAALVHLDSAVIRDTTRNAEGERVFEVEDSTGTARVVLDGDVSFPLSFPSDVIGTILEVTGLLLPSEAGGDWVLKPRTSSDIVVGPLSYPTVTIDSARAEPPETRLIIEGLALNGWNVFGDSTLHVADSTGAIRALRVDPVAIGAGDSIEVVGTTTTAFGQPVLRDTRTEVLRTGVVSPPADSVGTGTANTADTGALDAALVRIAGATVQDTGRTPDSDVVLTVDDGSGAVDVVLDRDITFFYDPDTIVGSTVDVTGVLVPSATDTGVWWLKPRRNDDLVVN